MRHCSLSPRSSKIAQLRSRSRSRWVAQLFCLFVFEFAVRIEKKYDYDMRLEPNPITTSTLVQEGVKSELDSELDLVLEYEVYHVRYLELELHYDLKPDSSPI